MTSEEFNQLGQKYLQAKDIKYKIDSLKKEIQLLKNVINDDNKIKDYYYRKVFPQLCPIDDEWQIQKILCQKIIAYALEIRIQQLQKQEENLLKL